ncbi:MAG: hypothetical protein ACJAT7_003884 [Psychromonas sp.]|jgi:hypothetical protein|uniref:hypothetical protein n=1 Tax=Psychromonas sp. TaxID=1884585 RepID=UPI0039E50618
MTTTNKEASSKYMSGDIRHLVNRAIQYELANLPATLVEIKYPVQKLNFLTKLMLFVCAPIKQVGVSTVRGETDEVDMFSI